MSYLIQPLPITGQSSSLIDRPDAQSFPPGSIWYTENPGLFSFLRSIAGTNSWLDIATGSPGTSGWSVYNVVSYGATGDGSADDAPAIQDAIDAASDAGGGIVYFPPGRYRLASAVNPKSNVTLKGDGPGASVLLQAYWPNASNYGVSQGGSSATTTRHTIQSTGSAGASRACSAVTFGDNTITGISSTSGISAGDVLILASDDLIPSSGSHKDGELIRVLHLGVFNSGDGSWNNTDTSLTMMSLAHRSYSTSPVLIPMTPIQNITVQDLEIINTAPGLSRQFFVSDAVASGSASAGSHATGLLGFMYAEKIRIEGCRFVDFDQQAVRLTFAWDAVVQNCQFINGTDNVPNFQWGYGVLLESACDSIAMTSNRFHRCRHAMTTGSVGTTGYYGGPRNWVFGANTATESANAAVDTHPEGGQGVIVGNFIGGLMKGPRVGSNAGESAGVHLRSPDTQILSNMIDWVAAGITVDGNANGCVVDGNTIRHVFNSDGIGIGAGGGSVDQLVVTNNILDQIVGNAIHVYNASGNNFTIDGNRIRNPGTVAGNWSAIKVDSDVTSTGHKITNNRAWRTTGSGTEPGTQSGRMEYIVNQSSTGVTSSFIANNQSIGSQVGSVNDVGANLQYRNTRLDTQSDLYAGESNSPGPQDNSLISWSFDVASAAGSTNMVSGNIYWIKVPLRANATITNVHFFLVTAGTVLTAGQCFAGIYSSTGALLRSTADLSSGANGFANTLEAIAPLTSPIAVNITTNPWVWVALLANFGGTAPAPLRASSQGIFGNIGGIAVARSRWAIALTAQAALVGPITPSTVNYNSATLHFWAGIS